MYGFFKIGSLNQNQMVITVIKNKQTKPKAVQMKRNTTHIQEELL